MGDSLRACPSSVAGYCGGWIGALRRSRPVGAGPQGSSIIPRTTDDNQLTAPVIPSFHLIQETWSFGTVEDPVSRESEFIGFAVYLPTFKDEPPRRKERKEDCFLLIRQERLRISNNLMPCGRSSLISLSCSWSLLFSGSSVYPVKYPSGISETYFTGVLIPKKEKSLAPLACPVK